MSSTRYRWYKELNRYHWFVLVVATLGWLFDSMDQQLFNLARVPAMRELLATSPGVAVSAGDVAKAGGYATSIFLIGWATGGLFFGVLGDRIGRAKTMLLTILVYSAFTGLSALSRGFWDFVLYRFLTGLGVGGEFAVGVALVAEVMPQRARPYALGLLQALSAIGNITAALTSIWFGNLEAQGVFERFQFFGVTCTSWRAMFVVGTLPALLAIVIRRRLKEPERWQQAREYSGENTRLGSYSELFGDPRWCRNAFVGMLLATSGIIGLWSIGFFSIDLTRSVFRKVFEDEGRSNGSTDGDRDIVRLIVRDPTSLDSWAAELKPLDLLDSSRSTSDGPAILSVIHSLRAQDRAISQHSVLAELDARGQTDKERLSREEFLSGEPRLQDGRALADRVSSRSAQLSGRVTRWAGYTSMMLNIGSFCGIYAFSIVTQRIGRRPAFAIAFVAALLSTVFVFWKMDDVTDVFWMLPLMGFCQVSVFGGYAIYFPELFPTRLRSTGTSFCYNVGRYLAAAGPLTLGHLTSNVFAGYEEPLRWAGISMCSVFILGLMTLPFCPETRGQPLPE